MTKFLLGLFAALAMSVSAAPVARQGSDSVTLRESPCPEALMSLLKERGVPDSFVQRAGDAIIDGKHYQLCWTPLPDGRVGIIFEDGDVGAIPIRAFHDDPGA